MWYEILPGFGIICGCVVASGLAIKTIDTLFHGKVGYPKIVDIEVFENRVHECCWDTTYCRVLFRTTLLTLVKIELIEQT